MPRTISVPSTDYARGFYGPYEVNGFNSSNTDRVVVEMTVENWPVSIGRLAVVRVDLSDGDWMEANIPSQPKNRDGTPATVVRISIEIPSFSDRFGNNGKKPKSIGTVSMNVEIPFRTAITVRAE